MSPGWNRGGGKASTWCRCRCRCRKSMRSSLAAPRSFPSEPKPLHFMSHEWIAVPDVWLPALHVGGASMLVTLAPPSSPSRALFPSAETCCLTRLDLDINVRCGTESRLGLLRAAPLESLLPPPALPSLVCLLSLFAVGPATSLSRHLFLMLSQLGLNFLVCGPEPHKYPFRALTAHQRPCLFKDRAVLFTTVGK